ncbi:cytochrome b [Pelagibius litoralis]|uniref:cytochrome b n=1 Tax=Pelagibius litoralis TaxID=374515 RepID=UPI0034605860
MVSRLIVKELDVTTYDRISRFNHWTAAILFLTMLGFGFYLAYGGLEMPQKLPLIVNHKAMGVLLLVWGIWRVGYRFRPSPSTLQLCDFTIQP